LNDSVTTGSMTNNSDPALFLAFISIATDSREVTGVEGLGLTWSQVGEICSRHDQQTLALWSARGVAQTGTVTANLSDNPFASTITVVRVDGGDQTPGSADVILRNQNGTNCGGGNNPESTYSFDVTSPDANALAVSVTSSLGVSHTPGSGWTAHSDVTSFSSRSSAQAVMTRTTDASGTTTVSGSFGRSTLWANITVLVPRP
jgi:hypothetical protein